jgi:hypothetical protein
MFYNNQIDMVSSKKTKKEKGYFQRSDNIGFSIRPFPRPFVECLSDALGTRMNAPFSKHILA